MSVTGFDRAQADYEAMAPPELTVVESEDHGEHYCGSRIYYDPELEIHMCTGMHDDPDIIVDECVVCEEA